MEVLGMRMKIVLHDLRKLLTPCSSRSDHALGDDHTFNYTFFSEAAAYFHNSTINVTDAAEARLARMTTMMNPNPDFSLDAGAESRSFIEQAFYLSIFGDPYIGVAQSDWVLEWFCKLWLT